MKTIKVIDLLNKIANGEDVPKRIKFYQTCYSWYDNGFSKGYCKEPVMADGNSFLEINSNYDLLKLVEIIEEDEEINIQDIEKIYINDSVKSIGESEIKFWTGRNLDLTLGNKINELIKAIKKLDKEMKNNA